MDRIYDAFPNDRRALADQIFLTMDGLNFASIAKCDSADFMLFVKVAEEELEKFLKDPVVRTSEFFDGIVKAWNELISFLEKDPRYGRRKGDVTK